MNKQKFTEQFIQQIIKEEYAGFKKDQNFKLKPEDDGFAKVAYLPKFNDIRRELKKYSSEFKGYTVSINPDIAQLAKDITKTFNQLGQLIYILDTNLKQQK